MDGKGVTLDVLKMVNNSWDKPMGKSLENGVLRDNLILLRDNLILRIAKTGFFTPSDTNKTVSINTKMGQALCLGQYNTSEVVQAFRADSERVVKLRLKLSDNPFSGLSQPNSLNASILNGFGTIFSKNLL